MAGQEGLLEPQHVSVVVVNHNYGRFLSRCLASIASQTYRCYDCLVIDNASSDDSVDVYRTFVGSLAEEEAARFRLIVSDINLHQTGACALGLRETNGGLVCFVDADDWLLAECLTTHAQAYLLASRNPGFTCGDMVQAVNGQVVSLRSPGVAALMRTGPEAADIGRVHDDVLPKDLALGLQSLADDLYTVEAGDGLHWPWSAMSAFCFRRDAVEMMFRRMPDLKGNTDGYLAHGISTLTSSLVIDRPLAVYCGHGSNIFLRHAPLDGFRAYDVGAEINNLSKLASEIIACHLQNMEDLVRRLDDPCRYPQALLDLCKLAKLVSGENATSDFLGLLNESHIRLEGCLGAAHLNAFRSRILLSDALNAKPSRPPWYERVLTRLGVPMFLLMIIPAISTLWRGLPFT